MYAHLYSALFSLLFSLRPTILIFFLCYYSISADLENASSTSAIILLVLWCQRLCLQEKNIPQSKISTDIKNVLQNVDDKFLPRSTSLDDNDIPFFFQLRACLLKIQNNFQSLEKLLNSNKKEFVIHENYDDTDFIKVEDNVNVRKILKIFSELWNVNTLGLGSALITLHCLRKKIEESTKFSFERKDIDNDEIYENIQYQRSRPIDVAAAVHALLDTVETLPTTRHPRLYFIISWLLTSTSAEHSSEQSSTITEDPYLSSNFMSKNVRKNCSVMNLFLLNYNNNINNDGGEYFTVNLPILPDVFEWLDSRVNDILTFRSSDVLNSDTLLIKGRALTSLIAKVSILFLFLQLLILLSSYQFFIHLSFLFNSLFTVRFVLFILPTFFSLPHSLPRSPPSLYVLLLPCCPPSRPNPHLSVFPQQFSLTLYFLHFFPCSGCLHQLMTYLIHSNLLTMQ